MLVRLPARNSLGWVPARRCDPESPPLPASSPVCSGPPAPIHTFPPPASCYCLPAVGQTGISAATWDSHASPASYSSGWPASRLPPSPAAQRDRPAALPLPYSDSAIGTGRPRVAVPHHCPDHRATRAGILPVRRRSSPFAGVSPRVPRAFQSRLDPVVVLVQACDFRAE